MARTKADSYTKAAVKAPRKVSVLTGGQASNVKAGSKASKCSRNSYCPRPKPEWQLSVDEFFPKPDEPFEIKDVKKKRRGKKPAETAVSSDEMVEVSCSVDEVDSENAGPSKSADEVDSENAGPSKSTDEVDSENAGPSESTDEVDSENAGPSKNAEEVDGEMAGPSKNAEEMDSEMAGPSKNADDVDSGKAGPSREYDAMDYEELRSVKVVCKGEIINANPLRDEDYFLIDDDTFVVIDEDELFQSVLY